jgi:hypothetical protein
MRAPGLSADLRAPHRLNLLPIQPQGEMVQAKFGISGVAVSQLEIYTTAVLLATLRPPRCMCLSCFGTHTPPLASKLARACAVLPPHGARHKPGAVVTAELALNSLPASAVTMLLPAPCPSPLRSPPKREEWRTVMEALSRASCESYRNVVHKDPLFIQARRTHGICFNVICDAILSRIVLLNQRSPSRPKPQGQQQAVERVGSGCVLGFFCAPAG